MRYLIAFVLLVVAMTSSAQDEAVDAGTQYIDLKPAFVVNYGGGGRLKYLKSDLSIRVTGNGAARAVRHHMPYIRNNLVLLFSRQSEEIVTTSEGRELLRQAALQEIRKILQEEEGDDPGVDNLLFNNFVVQK